MIENGWRILEKDEIENLVYTSPGARHKRHWDDLATAVAAGHTVRLSTANWKSMRTARNTIYVVLTRRGVPPMIRGLKDSTDLVVSKKVPK